MTALADEYRAQAAWRDWPRYLANLPLGPDRRILDIGCGTGDVTRLLAARAGEVIGVDRDPALLAVARDGAPANCRFVQADAAEVESLGVAPVDGVWSSFLAAYFPDLTPVLERWRRCLRPGGWMALVEVDSLLTGHGPLDAALRDDLVAFTERARAGGHYDFDMGRRLDDCATRAGLEVVDVWNHEDPELTFQGAANPAVLDAWRRRFRRLGGLRKRLGDARFETVEAAFIDCLKSPDHSCSASVVMVVAKRP